MAQRINPDTGYPMSTEKQIQQAKDLLYLSKPHLSDQDIEANLTNPYFDKNDKLRFCIGTLTSPYEFKADYFYKIGDYDEAEKDYLQIFFLDFKFANKLRILYQREKRYKDAAYITEVALHTFDDFSILCTNKEKEKLKSNLSKAEKMAQNHYSDDKSTIAGEDKVWIVQVAGPKLNQVAEWSTDIDNLSKQLSREQEESDNTNYEVDDSEPEHEEISKPAVKKRTTSRRNSRANQSSNDKIGCGCATALVIFGALIGQRIGGSIGATIGIILMLIIAIFGMI